MNPDLGAPTSYGFDLANYRRDLVRKYRPNKESGLLLDFGCGNGANTILFAPDFERIVGFDVEASRLEEARSKAGDLAVQNIEYRQYDGHRIPLDDSSVDAAVSFEVLEHTESDSQALAEIARLLRSGGGLCLTVPNKLYLMETHGFNLPFASRIPYHRIPLMNLLPGAFYRRFGRARIYTRSHIIELVKAAGLEVVHSEFVAPPFDKLRNTALREFARSCYARLPLWMGVSIFVAARKP